MAFVPTNNRDPYNSPCTLGPNLWSAGLLALDVTNGKWVWGFQALTHDVWDWDCSWWQALGNETVNGVNTQVLWKTCKAGYLYELNAKTGALIWSWTPPTNYVARCHLCYLLDPLNKTEMNWPFVNPTLQPTLLFPGIAGEIESSSSYSPTLNYLFVAAQNVPSLVEYVAPNSSNYKTNSGMAFFSPSHGPYLGNPPSPINNNTIFAINAATGQTVWNHFVPNQGYRGGSTVSGNVVFITLSSGDLLLLDAKTGATIRDLYIGGPLNVLPSIGATSSGLMQVIFPITAGIVTWGTSVPGDIVALTLQNVPAGGSNTVTTSVTVSATASVTTVTAGGTGVDATTLYGVAAVAVIFIIATGYLAMRGRKPAS
jgi:hypothetical protein